MAELTYKFLEQFQIPAYAFDYNYWRAMQIIDIVKKLV